MPPIFPEGRRTIQQLLARITCFRAVVTKHVPTGIHEDQLISEIREAFQRGIHRGCDKARFDFLDRRFAGVKNKTQTCGQLLGITGPQYSRLRTLGLLSGPVRARFRDLFDADVRLPCERVQWLYGFAEALSHVQVNYLRRNLITCCGIPVANIRYETATAIITMVWDKPTLMAGGEPPLIGPFEEINKIIADVWKSEGGDQYHLPVAYCIWHLFGQTKEAFVLTTWALETAYQQFRPGDEECGEAA